MHKYVMNQSKTLKKFHSDNKKSEMKMRRNLKNPVK